MKKKKLKIYIFRHGKTFYNKNHIFTGLKDSLLTPQGFKEARIIARKLKNKKFQVAFYTRLTRSKQTLKPVLKQHPECKKLIKDDRMIERCYGNLQGKSHASIIKKYGQKQFDLWHRDYNTRPPKGESFADVEKRVKKFIKYLKSFMKKNQVSVAISAHGNSIRLFRRVWEKLSIRETEKMFVSYDRVFEYTI